MKKELTEVEKLKMEAIKQTLQPGMLLTHTRCMGILEEHIFCDYNGNWINGDATLDTMQVNGLDPDDNWTNDISPLSITHINRIPVNDYLDVNFKIQGRDFRYHL